MANDIVTGRLFEVYMHKNKTNGKAYIGQTVCGVFARLGSHESQAKHGSAYPFHKALRMHGRDAFVTSVLAVCDTLPEALRIEQELILEYGTFGKGGYNATIGGEGTAGVVPTKARRKAISKQMKELVRTDQHKARISAAMKGRCNPAAVAAAANAKRGTKQDLVTKAASLAALAKAQEQWTGRTHSNDSKAAMRKTKSRPITITRPDGTKDRRITTLGALSEEYGMSTAGLSMAIAKGRIIRRHKPLSGCLLSWG